MNSKSLLLNCLFVALALALALPLGIHPVAAQPEPSASSGTPPGGYTPLRTEAGPRVPESGADILLIQTALPWGSDADQQVLDALGYSYDVVDMGNIGNVDLFGYPVVLIVNDQVQAFYDQYAAQVGDFTAYVESGGFLVFFAASDGWAGGTLQADLPGGVQVVTPHYENHNTLSASSHPIVTAELSDGIPLVNADLYSNYCSHGYFTSLPAGAVEIFEESHGYPTLIEYRLGSGTILASTQTWEHNWKYHTGGDAYGTFGRKALDDLFLYAFGGGAVPTDDIQLDLRVEDAPDSVTVDKSAGSFVDIVARISGGDEYAPSVTVEIPGDLFGSPTTTFVRNLPDGTGSQSVAWDSPGAGKYRILTTLVALAGGGMQPYYKEVVWRFRIPAGAAPQSGVAIKGIIAVPGLAIANPDDSVKLDIIEWGLSLVITDRQLLFDRYGTGGNWNKVVELLEAMYESLSFWWGEVFYVERYGVAWNQGTDEGAANTVTTQIDDLVEDWVDQLTVEGNGYTLDPEFLMIVGGDEVIPFRRMDDDDYETLPCWLPDEVAPCEEDIGPDNASDPILNAYEDNFFLSDNIYADVGGGLSDWEKGELELSVGRIVGASAEDMRTLIRNGDQQTASLADAAAMSLKGSQTPGIEAALNAKNVAIYGLQNPDMVDNDNWTRQQFLDAWVRDYQIYYYGGHGSYASVPGTANWASSIPASGLTQGQIATNHPLLVADACNLGVPTDQDGASWQPSPNDSIAYKLANLGMGGMIMSTGISSYNGGKGTDFGEQLVNDYVDELVGTGSDSDWFGTALLQAKQNFAPSGFPFGLTWTRSDKKTMLEFVYYGVPWTFMPTPDNTLEGWREPPEAPGFAVESTVAGTGESSYSRDISVSVSSYAFTPVGAFELLEIPGAEQIYALQEPVLPYVLTTLDLPPGSAVLDAQIVGQHGAGLGAHDIPAADPVSMYHPTTGYTSTMSVTGDYPSVRYTVQATAYPDRTQVRVGIAPATFNVESHQVTLYDATTLRVTYTAPVPVAVHALSFPPQTPAGAPIEASALIENVGGTARTLTGRLDLYDAAGALVGSLAVPPFTVGGGATHELAMTWSGSLAHGGYSATLAIYEGEVWLATAAGSFSVIAGAVTEFSVPPTLSPGSYGTIGLTFANYRPAAVTAVADVSVRDAHGIQVARLLQRSFTVAAHDAGSTEWQWTPDGLLPGAYTLKAVVTAEGVAYAATPQDLVVLSHGPGGIYLPLVVRGASEACTLTYQTVDGDSLPSADQDAYSLRATAGTLVSILVDTVASDTAFDVEACLSTTASSADCFAYGDDNTACTYPPPSYACPRIEATLPSDPDGTYYLFVESGSGSSNYAGPVGIYRATISSGTGICRLVLVGNNRPGTFLGNPAAKED